MSLATHEGKECSPAFVNRMEHPFAHDFDKSLWVPRVHRSLDKGEGRPLSQGEPSGLKKKKKRKKKNKDREGTRARLFRVGVRPIVRYRTRAVHGERDNE